MKNILVTGGTGFLGGRTARMLLERGCRVRITGRNAAAAHDLQEQGAEFYRIDLSKGVPEDLLDGIDTIVHSAALSSPWGRYQDFHATNVMATEHLCSTALQAGITRLVHISTPSIYFMFEDRLDIRESDPLPRKQVNYYSQTKLSAERIVQTAAAKGLPSVILRPRGIFGPGDNAILGRLLKASAGPGIPLIRDGNFHMDITYVDNVVDAIISSLAVNLPAATNCHTFNITNGQPWRFSDLLEEMARALSLDLKLKPVSYKMADMMAKGLEQMSHLTGSEPTFTRYTVGLLAFSQTLNIDEARLHLGYKPGISIAEGLRRCAPNGERTPSLEASR